MTGHAQMAEGCAVVKCSLWFSVSLRKESTAPHKMNVECSAHVSPQTHRNGVKFDNRLAHVTGRKLLGPRSLVCQWNDLFVRYPFYLNIADNIIDNTFLYMRSCLNHPVKVTVKRKCQLV